MNIYIYWKWIWNILEYIWNWYRNIYKINLRYIYIYIYIYEYRVYVNIFK